MTEVTLTESGRGEIGKSTFPDIATCKPFQNLDVGRPINREFSKEGFEPPGISLKGMPVVVPAGKLCQRITMDNGKVFTREVQIRFDASGHDGSDVHFNIDMITRLEGYPKTYSHKEELHFVVQDKLPHYYFMKLYDPGLRRPPFYIGVCWGFQFKEDREYSEKQDEFIRKLRARELTPEYEKWYKDNVFDPAATRYQERKRNNSPLKPKDITKD